MKPPLQKKATDIAKLGPDLGDCESDLGVAREIVSLETIDSATSKLASVKSTAAKIAGTLVRKMPQTLTFVIWHSTTRCGIRSKRDWTACKQTFRHVRKSPT